MKALQLVQQMQPRNHKQHLGLCTSIWAVEGRWQLLMHDKWRDLPIWGHDKSKKEKEMHQQQLHKGNPTKQYLTATYLPSHKPPK